MELKQFLRCAISLAVALRQVHRREVIHKDVKPANVLANAALDQARLTGFGICLAIAARAPARGPPNLSRERSTTWLPSKREE